MIYPFNALLARMKYITRWSLMHSVRAESLSEHTCDTALIAHTLCLIARRYTGTPCRPKTVTVAALYHDASEIITGDMPTPVKYRSDVLRDAYKAIERESAAAMASMLPPRTGGGNHPLHHRGPAHRPRAEAAQGGRPAVGPHQVSGGDPQRQPRV